MKLRQKAYYCQGIAIAASTLIFSHPVVGQIIPDATLNVNSNITPQGNTLTIEGGTRAGNNLFHSFTEFSLPTGSEAFFNNAIDVQNIFSRVTGGNISNIDGLIRANGGANLFLLNPAGIVFGPNARLDIGGSFFGTTANSIRFADGIEFSATNTTGTRLLTISVPIGLQMGQNPGAIQVQGSGHTLATVTNFLQPLGRLGESTTGLRMQAGKTLALVGGDILLPGGIITAPSGHIEIGSVRSGSVTLNSTLQGWNFDYTNVSGLGNIQLSGMALVDVTGTPGGSIQLWGSQIRLADGSNAITANRGSQAAGNISVYGSELVQLTEVTPDSRVISSGLRSENLSSGRGGDITVNTARLQVQAGAVIFNRVFSSGDGGNTTLNATQSLEIFDYSKIGGFPGLISELSFGSGAAGEIVVSTQRLTIRDGTSISGSTFGNNGGKGGSLVINADIVDLAGANRNLIGASSLFASSNGSGQGGSIRVNTRILSLKESATITTTARGSGAAGTIEINASESVEVSGFVPGVEIPGGINSDVLPPLPIQQQILGLAPIPTATGSNTTINTPLLIVSDRGQVSVGNQGSGIGGSLLVNANLIQLDNQGLLSATTASGRGGNITLNAARLIIMRHGSEISAAAGAMGDGGNITIDAPAIVGLENSDIIANAVQGRGGNIQIITQGIFGLANRPQLTPGSDISASSEFGLSGTVAISNPEVDTRSLLVELPQNLVDTSQQITSGCAADKGNVFTIAGRGGLPENPTSGLLGRAIWWDGRDLSAISETAAVPAQTPEMIEATGWVINHNGTVELVAQKSHVTPGYNVPGCRSLVAN